VESATSIDVRPGLHGNRRIPDAGAGFRRRSGTYFRTFPGLRLLEAVTSEGREGCRASEARSRKWKALSAVPWHWAPTSSSRSLTGTRSGSVPLLGRRRRVPIRNDTLDSIVLTDPSKPRELFDYLILENPAAGRRGRLSRVRIAKPVNLDALFFRGAGRRREPREGGEARGYREGARPSPFREEAGRQRGGLEFRHSPPQGRRGVFIRRSPPWIRLSGRRAGPRSSSIGGRPQERARCSSTG
jgi:hypothetical protein